MKVEENFTGSRRNVSTSCGRSYFSCVSPFLILLFKKDDELQSFLQVP